MSSEKRPQDITSAERVMRINTIKQLLIQGANRQQIIEYCANEFKVTSSCVDLYLQNAKDEIKENFQKNYDKEYFKANLIERLEDLYKQNYDLDDFRQCQSIIKDFTVMLGLTEATKIDHTTQGKKIQTIINLGGGINPNETTD